MKRLGHLENGKILLECSEAEWRAFALLSDAAQGLATWGFERREALGRNGVDTDLQPVFAAILQWIRIKDHANQLRALAADIDAAIAAPDVKPPDGESA